MRKLVLTTVIAAAVIIVTPPARIAAAEELIKHTVQQGDTLWDLSGGYLEDELLWPGIWRLNPEIDNPHWIYPGQDIKIPLLAPPRAAVAPPVTPPAPVKARERLMIEPNPELAALARQRSLERQPLAVRLAGQEHSPTTGQLAQQDAAAGQLGHSTRGSGRISRELPADGRVVGTERGWQHAASGETVLIVAPGAALVQQFGVYRDRGPISPSTPGGQSPGHLLADIAIVEVVAVKGAGHQAKVHHAFSELKAGDLLGPLPE